MKGIKECPYCHGEVEVIRLANDKQTGKKMYRIQCLQCNRTVGRGLGFADETKEEAMERIKQYETVLNKQLGIIK